MKLINTSSAALPGGHYSQAVQHRDTLYVSGLLPIRAGDHQKELGTIEDQLNVVLENLTAVLAAAGSAPDLVIRTTVYIADMAHWSKVNAAYQEFFGNHKPARVVVPVTELHYGFLVELGAIAVVAGEW